jgi:hypothetical protein
MYGKQVLGAAAAIVLILSGAAVGRSSLEAQPASAAERRFGGASSAEDVLPALLVEVKGLRAAMEQMAGAGPRVQLSVGRLQLQEGRIAGMIRRLDTVRDTLTTARKELEGMKGALKMFKVEEGRNPAQKDDLPFPFGNFKEGAAAAEANIARLVAEEAQLVQDIATEQARWTEINQRLEELERALAPKR